MTSVFDRPMCSRSYNIYRSELKRNSIELSTIRILQSAIIPFFTLDQKDTREFHESASHPQFPERRSTKIQKTCGDDAISIERKPRYSRGFFVYFELNCSQIDVLCLCKQNKNAVRSRNQMRLFSADGSNAICSLGRVSFNRTNVLDSMRVCLPGRQCQNDTSRKLHSKRPCDATAHTIRA